MCVCVCVCVCMYICIYMCIIMTICDKISSTDTLIKQLWRTCGYITTNKKTNKQTNKQTKRIHSGRRQNLISSAGKPEQKWLYENSQNRCFDYQLISSITCVTIFSWPLIFSFKLLNEIFQIFQWYAHWLAFSSWINK